MKTHEMFHISSDMNRAEKPERKINSIECNENVGDAVRIETLDGKTIAKRKVMFSVEDPGENKTNKDQECQFKRDLLSGKQM